jgi:hypothetical protein
MPIRMPIWAASEDMPACIKPKRKSQEAENIVPALRMTRVRHFMAE